jgi:magnesium-protoporphyrin IX monomethyl ester (oxidative) cyclase
MALGLLKACLAKENIESTVFYENLRFADIVGETEYDNIFNSRQNIIFGEFIFAAAAYGKENLDIEGYAEWVVKTSPLLDADKERFIRTICKWQAAAEKFCDSAAEKILAIQPKIAAFASLFQQNNAAIAVAKRLKKKDSRLKIMFGGANCHDAAGKAMLDFVGEIDYVFLGEADEIFAAVCKAELTNDEAFLSALPKGVIGRKSPVAVEHRITKYMDALPYPDFAEYYSFKARANHAKDTSLLVEGSRGCWWGEKNPCTFCGLNGIKQMYRQKSTARLAREIKVQAEKYHAKRCVFTDSILSSRHLKELPQLKDELPQNASYFSEVKSNIAEADLAALRDMGFVCVQPGIESLQDDVLRLMNKGCRAIKQVETLRNLREFKMDAIWNLLCGFPEEKIAFYEEILELLPKITHLKPPNGLAHIVYQKNSVYTENREKFALDLRPSEAYRFIYPKSGKFIADFACVFEPVDERAREIYYDCRKKHRVYEKLSAFIKSWKEDYAASPDRLDMKSSDAKIELCDLRRAARQTFYTLTGARRDIYSLCRTAAAEEKIFAALRGKYAAEEIASALKYLCGNMLLLHIGQEYLALAINN